MGEGIAEAKKGPDLELGKKNNEFVLCGETLQTSWRTR